MILDPISGDNCDTHAVAASQMFRGDCQTPQKGKINSGKLNPIQQQYHKSKAKV